MSAALSVPELEAVAAQLGSVGVRVDGALTARLIAGGRSNLTFLLADSASRWVLRMPPRHGRTPSAHDVAREFRVTSALAGSGVPVAPAVALCEDESVLGGPFAVAQFVDGRSVQSRADLDALEPATVELAVDRLVETLAALHDVDHVSVGLEHFGRPRGYFERQLRRWAGQWELIARDDDPLRRLADELVVTLAANMPEQRRTSIVHGDFRIDNTILDLLGDDVSVAAVVDWELSTIGDPVADVAMMCAYRHSAFDLVLGAPAAWTSERLPSAADLAARYEASGGVCLEGWEEHLCLAYFKIAVIAAGIDHRHRAAGSDVLDTAGDAVAPLLEAGRDAARARV